MRRPPAALLAVLLPALGLAAEEVGPETCRACHPSQWESWRAGPHARAFAALPERSRADRRCLGCHAPALEAGLEGVGCEACHGPGRFYAARHVMRDAELARALGLVDPGEKVCLGCHTEATPSLERFDVAKKLPLIAHPDPPPAAAPASGTPPAARPPAGGPPPATRAPAPVPATAKPAAGPRPTRSQGD